MKCLVCGSSSLEKLETPKYGLLVAGNRNPFEKSQGIEKCICEDCGHIQAFHNTIYAESIQKIFTDYGAQRNKSFGSGSPVLREHLIIEKLIKVLQLPKRGNFLDIGCGSGVAMNYFHSRMPEWEVYGMDISEAFREQVVNAGGGYYASLSEIYDSGKKYDLVTINYVLSVADNPGEILDCVRSILSEQGILFIIDINFTVQPYLFNVVEISSFLTKISLQNILLRKGFEEFPTDFEHESKEIWSFSKIKGQIQQQVQNFYKENKKIYIKALDYLNDVVSMVEKVCCSNNKLAIWGMSNGGIWVAEIIKKLSEGVERQIVWIEEDEDLLQKEYGVYEYPICRIDSVDPGTVVFLPFPPYVAQNIMKRHSEYSEKLKFIFFG